MHINLQEGLEEDDIVDLLRSKHDAAGHHMLWVSKKGDLWLETIPDSMSPAQYEKSRSQDMQFRFETFQAGNGYVGEEASKDRGLVRRLHTAVTTHWKKGTKGYVDIF